MRIAKTPHVHWDDEKKRYVVRRRVPVDAQAIIGRKVTLALRPSTHCCRPFFGGASLNQSSTDHISRPFLLILIGSTSMAKGAPRTCGLERSSDVAAGHAPMLAHLRDALGMNRDQPGLFDEDASIGVSGVRQQARDRARRIARDTKALDLANKPRTAEPPGAVHDINNAIDIRRWPHRPKPYPVPSVPGRLPMPARA